jgi:hypothetical protein
MTEIQSNFAISVEANHRPRMVRQIEVVGDKGVYDRLRGAAPALLVSRRRIGWRLPGDGHLAGARQVAGLFSGTPATGSQRCS